MLRSYLTVSPHTKFILIQDSINQQGKEILDFLVKSHLTRSQETRVHYFVFHGSFHRAKRRYSGNVLFHDFTSDVCGWNKSEKKDFESVASRLSASDIVIVDSLVHALYLCGLAQTYRVLNNLKTLTGVQQMITLLHADLLEAQNELVRYFEHLCTLSIRIEPKFISGNGRLQYTYKKVGGKVINQMEEYKFEGDNFVTQKIDKLDPKALLQNTGAEVNPETLTTFRIGLNNQEISSRDGLALPYVYETPENQTPAEIHYDYDKDDDFDEEDPDDDLDF